MMQKKQSVSKFNLLYIIIRN